MGINDYFQMIVRVIRPITSKGSTSIGNDRGTTGPYFSFDILQQLWQLFGITVRKSQRLLDLGLMNAQQIANLLGQYMGIGNGDHYFIGPTQDRFEPSQSGHRPGLAQFVETHGIAFV